MLDKIVLVNKNELVLIFTDKAPFYITAPDALATYEWMHSETKLDLNEFIVAVSSESEDTVTVAA